jgi:small-conductance mechanosensitive channel
MAERHGAPMAGRLKAAAELYEQVLARLASADTSKQAFATAAGRERLAALVDEIAGIEAKAVNELENAAKAVG